MKQEPGTEDSYSCPSSSLKTERGKDGRSACMVGVLHLYDVLSVRRTSGFRVCCFRVNIDLTAPVIMRR